MEKGSEKSYDKWGFLILCLKTVAGKKYCSSINYIRQHYELILKILRSSVWDHKIC